MATDKKLVEMMDSLHSAITELAAASANIRRITDDIRSQPESKPVRTAKRSKKKVTKRPERPEFKGAVLLDIPVPEGDEGDDDEMVRFRVKPKKGQGTTTALELGVKRNDFVPDPSEESSAAATDKLLIGNKKPKPKTRKRVRKPVKVKCSQCGKKYVAEAWDANRKLPGGDVMANVCNSCVIKNCG